MYSTFPSLVVVTFSLACVKATTSVQIAAGTVQGTTCSSGASAFLSVPFAVPPVGELRWTAPKSYKQTFPTNGYNATAKGPICIQFGGANADPGTESEDCLYLDIWAPANATSSSSLPVKVWVYGGSDQGGSINNVNYDGCNLATHGTLVVSIAYRVGPLGFLTLADADIAGNFGVQDLLLGLEWVQTNIAVFGGDPKKVVLFGQSAGALDVFLLSTLPQAPTLFKSAIWESGPGPQLITASGANNLGATFAANVNCSTTDAACLRALSTLTIQTAAPEGDFQAIYSAVNPCDMEPHVDGVLIPAQPWSAGPKVPMIFGSNADEGALFVIGEYQTVIVTEANYTNFLKLNFGPAASLVETQYPLTLPAFVATGFPAFAAMSTIITEVQYRCPSYQALLKAQANNIPVYAYFDSHVPSCQWLEQLPAEAIPFVGATHTSEIPYVFGNSFSLPQPNGTCSFTAQEDAISADLIAAWTAMAETGNPSVQDGLQWPEWNSTASLGVNIVNSTSVGAIDFSQCSFWDEINDLYLNFTTSSDTGTSGAGATSSSSSSTASSTTQTSSGGRRFEFTAWGFIMAAGIAVFIFKN